MEVELKMAPSPRRPLDGQGVRRIPKMTQACRTRQSLNGKGVHKAPEKLKSKKPNIGLNVRVGSWNLGSISGRGMEMCEQLRRRKVDMLSTGSEVEKPENSFYGRKGKKKVQVFGSQEIMKEREE